MIQIQFDPETERELRKTDTKSRQRLSHYIETLVARDLEDWFDVKTVQTSKDTWIPNPVTYSSFPIEQEKLSA